MREGAAEEGGEGGGKKGKEKKEAKAGVLSLPAEVAPYKAVILPLDGRVAGDPIYAEQAHLNPSPNRNPSPNLARTLALTLTLSPTLTLTPSTRRSAAASASR